MNFDANFDTLPHLRLMKELFFQAFGTPRAHPKSKPFVDRVRHAEPVPQVLSGAMGRGSPAPLPHRRIAASPHRRIAASPHRTPRRIAASHPSVGEVNESKTSASL